MNPYNDLPSTAFWKLSVASKNLLEIDNLWSPKFNLEKQHSVVTFGSCFAQHIGRALKDRGYNWQDHEPQPYGMSETSAALFGYNIFSARTGNIYTTSLLKQWTEWALGKSVPPDEFWEMNSRFIDPFRPRIEPNGFESFREMAQSRGQTLRSFRTCIETADFFVFTLGLTESWFNSDGYEYPMCPGTVAGEFNAERHKFNNQRFNEVLHSLNASIIQIREINPHIRFILTVSPVPLAATNSNNHVLIATMESKSILRAVAAQLVSEHSYIDYFPSYEIINSPVFRGTFFEPNLRNVSAHGVNFVMDNFFNCISNQYCSNKNAPKDVATTKLDARLSIGTPVESNDDHCDEALLEAFGPRDIK